METCNYEIIAEIYTITYWKEYENGSYRTILECLNKNMARKCLVFKIIELKIAVKCKKQK